MKPEQRSRIQMYAPMDLKQPVRLNLIGDPDAIKVPRWQAVLVEIAFQSARAILLAVSVLSFMVALGFFRK